MARFEQDKIATVKTITEARAVLERITVPSTVVLFENDLPDLYQER